MGKIFKEKDAEFSILAGKKIAIIGFGSQGHAHALNLKESGVEVSVALRRNSRNREKAKNYGLNVLTIPEAVKQCEIIMLLIPDEDHKSVFDKEIVPDLKEGKTLMFAHGFSTHYSQVITPEGIDVVMVAPKGPGHMVRREFQKGRGVPALIAVHRDYSGNAEKTALAYAHGIGSTRAGVFKTTFEEETETDLFGEQAILCGGVTSLMSAGFETLVEAGYQPEMAYFECINEMKLIIDLIYEGGFNLMRYSISNTAEYGDYITQKKLITSETRKKMKEILNDIREGKFAKEWINENFCGRPVLNSARNRMKNSQVEKTGRLIRKMMPWLSTNKQGEKNEE